MMTLIVVIWLMIFSFKLFFALRILRAADKKIADNIDNVTILQPILSGDPALESVLEMNLRTLSGVHFVWLIDRDDAEAGEITARLKQHYPEHDIQIGWYPPAPEGINPKLFKLEQGRTLVKTEIVLVLDDDAVLSEAALRGMIGELDDHSLVTALPWYQAAENIPSQLLTQFVNDNSALTYLPLLPFTAPLTINGMCYALPLRVLADAGGFSPILHHLTDDLALATLLAQNDVRIIQSASPVGVQTSVPDTQRYVRQMHRWFLFATLLMREKSPGVNWVIFMLQGLHPLLLWTLLILACGGNTGNIIVLATVLLIRHFGLRRVQLALSRDIPAHPVLSLLSELLQPVHLLHALINRTIYWRSRRYRIFSNDRFHSL